MTQRRLLLVEHRARLLEGLSASEAAEGWRLHHAGHVEQALALLEMTTVDAVLCEGSPRGMEAVDFLAAVRTRWPRVARLLMSGGARLEALTAALRDGTIERLLEPDTEPATAALAVDTLLRARSTGAPDEPADDPDEPEADEFRIEPDEIGFAASHSAWCDESGAPEPPSVITLDADAVEQDVDGLLEALQAELERFPDDA